MFTFVCLRNHVILCNQNIPMHNKYCTIFWWNTEGQMCGHTCSSFLVAGRRWWHQGLLTGGAIGGFICKWQLVGQKKKKTTCHLLHFREEHNCITPWHNTGIYAARRLCMIPIFDYCFLSTYRSHTLSFLLDKWNHILAKTFHLGAFCLSFSSPKYKHLPLALIFLMKPQQLPAHSRL